MIRAGNVWPYKIEGWNIHRSTVVSVLCLGGISFCTLISFVFNQNLASTGFLYLIFVILAALYGGFRQATFISLISVACLDYFFDPPVLSFRVDRLSNWIELGAFEFTALVVSRLSTRAAVRMREAVAERRSASRLYEAARRILLIDNYGDTGGRIAALVRSEFDLDSVVLFDALRPEVHVSGEAIPDEEKHALVAQTREAYTGNRDTFAARQNIDRLVG